jgi:hypothetical protein
MGSLAIEAAPSLDTAVQSYAPRRVILTAAQRFMALPLQVNLTLTD